MASRKVAGDLSSVIRSHTEEKTLEELAATQILLDEQNSIPTPIERHQVLKLGRGATASNQQGKPEGRADSGFALDADLTTHHLHQAAGDRKRIRIESIERVF